MRGNSLQAASARLRAETPAQRWSTWLARFREDRRRLRLEQLETIVRLQAETRRQRQSGEAPRLRPWL